MLHWRKQFNPIRRGRYNKTLEVDIDEMMKVWKRRNIQTEIDRMVELIKCEKCGRFYEEGNEMNGHVVMCRG